MSNEQTMFKTGGIIDVKGEPSKTVLSPLQETAQFCSLVSKLCAVGEAIGRVEKSGYNEFHKYAYATESDIVSMIRLELYKRKVFIFPSFKSVEREEITVSSFKGERKTALTKINVGWTFCDGDTGAMYTVMVPGVGEDTADKGLYKAFTGAEKYLLMKSFLLPTGDDPERDTKEERAEAKESGKAAAKAVAERKIQELKDKARPAVDGSPEKGPAWSLGWGLAYVWPTELEGKVAHVYGSRESIQSNLELLRSCGSYIKNPPDGEAPHWVIPADKFDDLAYQLEQRHVVFTKYETRAFPGPRGA